LLRSQSMDSKASKKQANGDSKELGIQWDTLRDLITWNHVSGDELSADQNGSFDELSKCVVKIPPKLMNDKLTAFIRRHYQVQSKMVVSHWLREMKMNVMEDICTIIDSFYFNQDGDKLDEDTLSISADWFARDKEQSTSSPQRGVNQSRFFTELQSVFDGEESKDILGVTVTLAGTEKAYSWYKKKTSILHLNAGGSYVFDVNEYLTWFETESMKEPKHEETDFLKHCGVWDYKGDQIVMNGLGFKDRVSTEEDEDGCRWGWMEGTKKFAGTFSSKSAIQRPVPFKQPDDISYKRRKRIESNLSLVVYF